MATATLIQNLVDFTGDARLYKLEGGAHDGLVHVSAHNGRVGAFPCKANGMLTKHTPLAMIYRSTDHAAALRSMGYEVA